jgi:hypothetical protein
LAFFHLKLRSLIVLLKCEQLPLKSLLPLSFTGNLATAETVPSCAQKLWVVHWTTHLSKSSISVNQLGT